MPCNPGCPVPLQVVGFGSGWHAAVTMAQVSSKVHAVRLAQCCEVELHLEARGGKVRRARPAGGVALPGVACLRVEKLG